MNLRQQIEAPANLIRSYEAMRKSEGFPTEKVAMLYAGFVTEDNDTLLHVTEVRLERTDCRSVRREELLEMIGVISNCTYEAFYSE